jgi:hypothetical protein
MYVPLVPRASSPCIWFSNTQCVVKSTKILCSWFMFKFEVHGFVNCKYISIYIKQVATFIQFIYVCLETVLHVSGITSTHHQERKQLYLQHLVFVRPLLLPASSGR